MKRFIILMVSAIILTVSCKDKETRYYVFQGAEMGTIENAVFTTDNGVRLIVKSAPDGCDINTKRRVMLYYILETEGQQNIYYDISVSAIAETTLVEPQPSENAEETAEGDPLDIVQGWFSGGYLNVQVMYYVDPEKETPQTFSSCYTCKKSLSSIAIRRDGQGEGYFSVENPSECHSFICIPMKRIWDDFCYFLNEGGDVIHIPDDRTMPVSLNWKWYADSDGNLLSDTVSKNTNGLYKADE